MAQQSPSARQVRPRFRPWMAALVIAILIVVAAAASTRVLTPDQAQAVGTQGGLVPADYAKSKYDSVIVPGIKAAAVDLATLTADLSAGKPESDFGHSPGTSSAYSFPVTFMGVAGSPNGSILPVTVPGLPGEVTVQVQIGPALNGTAIRDVTGTVNFNAFTNQLDFQKVATEFNNLVKAEVLSDVDPTVIAGKSITVVGAYTRVNPSLVSVVPVSLTVHP